jgi:hypothetical protein
MCLESTKDMFKCKLDRCKNFCLLEWTESSFFLLNPFIAVGQTFESVHDTEYGSYDCPFSPILYFHNLFPDQFQIRRLVLRLYSVQSVVRKDTISTYCPPMGQGCCHYKPASYYWLPQNTQWLSTSATWSSAAVLDFWSKEETHSSKASGTAIHKL